MLESELECCSWRVVTFKFDLTFTNFNVSDTHWTRSTYVYPFPLRQTCDVVLVIFFCLLLYWDVSCLFNKIPKTFCHMNSNRVVNQLLPNTFSVSWMRCITTQLHASSITVTCKCYKWLNCKCYIWCFQFLKNKHKNLIVIAINLYSVDISYEKNRLI